MADYAKDVLVDTQWLEDHLNDDSIRIVEVDENPALYAEAHIPGAIGFDWRKDLQDQVRRDFLGPEDFAKLFGGGGVYGHRQGYYGGGGLGGILGLLVIILILLFVFGGLGGHTGTTP